MQQRPINYIQDNEYCATCSARVKVIVAATRET